MASQTHLNAGWTCTTYPSSMSSMFLSLGGRLVTHLQTSMHSWWPIRALALPSLHIHTPKNRHPQIHPHGKPKCLFDHHGLDCLPSTCSVALLAYSSTCACTLSLPLTYMTTPYMTTQPSQSARSHCDRFLCSMASSLRLFRNT